MRIFDKIFSRQKNKQTVEKTYEKKIIPTLEEFPHLNVSERMSIIMILGDTGKSDYFPFLKYALLHDSDQNVKFAALKRIHLFKDNPEIVQMLTEIKNNDDVQKIEPYFSMALSRLGIISMKEFENTINNLK